jgi:hypothetical protein
VCDRCAQECERHSKMAHCAACAKACRACAEQCRSMSGAAARSPAAIA